MRSASYVLHSLLLVAALALCAVAQQPQASSGTSENGGEAAAQNVANVATETRQRWNELENRWLALRIGLAIVWDGTDYSQDQANIEQLGALEPAGKFRANRLILSGRIKFSHPILYLIAGNYNGQDRPQGTNGWTLTDLAFTIPINHDLGAITIGKQREGTTLDMLAISTTIPFMERSASTTAFLPTRNDGVRIQNTIHSTRMTWTAAWYNNFLTDRNSFDDNGNQFIGRLTAAPIYKNDGEDVLHVAVNLRYSESKFGQLRFRTKPEDDAAAYIIDTGNFKADHAISYPLELYAMRGPLSVESEGILTHVSGGSTGNPWLMGYYAALSYFLTGEHRKYQLAGAFPGRVIPKHPFSFRHPARGSWEIALRYSHTDLTGGTIHGGVFSRLTPAISWYATRQFRFEFNYGYGRLDRFDRIGHPEFYQCRVQFEL